MIVMAHGSVSTPSAVLGRPRRDQPHLALLLQHALSQAGPGANTAAQLARVVRRLLVLVKQRCGLPGHAWSLELSPPPVSPPYLRSLRGPGRSICTPWWTCVANPKYS